jgi:hypothetical protein
MLNCTRFGRVTGALPAMVGMRAYLALSVCYGGMCSANVCSIAFLTIRPIFHIPTMRKSLQNRVDPWGDLNAVPSRGTLMGNRGILHNDQQQVVRKWARKPWVSCLVSYGEVKRVPFSAGNYSELFFLDEATALAAGHRPCNTCQRHKHIAFKMAWLKANRPGEENSFVPIATIDHVLHEERVTRDGHKITFHAKLADLPDGTIFVHNEDALLVWREHLWRWSFDGYSPAEPIPSATIVPVLTPRSIVRMLASGYPPDVHASAT